MVDGHEFTHACGSLMILPTQQLSPDPPLGSKSPATMKSTNDMGDTLNQDTWTGAKTDSGSVGD